MSAALITRRHFVAAWDKGHVWFRLFGVGLAWTDHRIHRPLFSERNAGKHGIRRRRYLHVGPYCLTITTGRRA